MTDTSIEKSASVNDPNFTPNLKLKNVWISTIEFDVKYLED